MRKPFVSLNVQIVCDEWMICRSPTFRPSPILSDVVITNSVIYYFHYVVVDFFRSASLSMLSFFDIHSCISYATYILKHEKHICDFLIISTSSASLPVSFRALYKILSCAGAPPLTLTFLFNQMYRTVAKHFKNHVKITIFYRKFKHDFKLILI